MAVASTSALERLDHPTWHLGPVRSRSAVKTLEPSRGTTAAAAAAAADDEAEIAGMRPETGDTKRCFPGCDRNAPEVKVHDSFPGGLEVKSHLINLGLLRVEPKGVLGGTGGHGGH